MLSTKGGTCDLSVEVVGSPYEGRTHADSVWSYLRVAREN
jgi:hypothetical protein